jgi:hypothetical protein
MSQAGFAEALYLVELFVGVGDLESGGELLVRVLKLWRVSWHLRGVVPDLDVVVDRAGERDACLASSAVEQLVRQVCPMTYRPIASSRGSTDGVDRSVAAPLCRRQSVRIARKSFDYVGPCIRWPGGPPAPVCGSWP